jgi:hypothetical protein
MSLAEVKRAIEKMSDREQLDLTEFLQSKLDKNLEWQREIARRMREMDEGKKITSAEFEKRHRELETEGR